jgi:2-polyprenyl-3-methyl-5-hydroxy-6-metoxy-1,4-benzoquinol methylase
MSNIDTYEQNIPERLAELRKGDPSYELHTKALIDAIIYSNELHENIQTPRVLDCGCGRGFLTATLSRLGMDITGIDPSLKSIQIAKKEHKNIPFWNASAESFPQIMEENNLELYDHAIINMVLHSVDDDTARGILRNLRSCIHPGGTLLIITPQGAWIREKLEEYAQDQELNQVEKDNWIEQQLTQDKIIIPFKIRGGEYYPKPLTIYNRNLDDYAELLRSENYGVVFNTYSEERRKKIHSVIIPYLTLDDYTTNCELHFGRRRPLLMSFALDE